MSSRNKSQLTSGHSNRGACKNDNTKQSTAIRAVVGGASHKTTGDWPNSFWTPEPHPMIMAHRGFDSKCKCGTEAEQKTAQMHSVRLLTRTNNQGQGLCFSKDSQGDLVLVTWAQKAHGRRQQHHRPWPSVAVALGLAWAWVFDFGPCCVAASCSSGLQALSAERQQAHGAQAQALRTVGCAGCEVIYMYTEAARKPKPKHAPVPPSPAARSRSSSVAHGRAPAPAHPKIRTRTCTALDLNHGPRRIQCRPVRYCSGGNWCFVCG
jgi:hypothetical protein